MGGQHHGGVLGRRRQLWTVRLGNAGIQPGNAGDAKINLVKRVGLLIQPLPGCADGAAVDRIVGFGVNLVGADDDASGGRDRPPGAVQPPETLTQGIQAGALGNQAVEVQVSADFQRLRCHDD